MTQQFNKREILSNLIPVVENTAMRYDLIPIEVSLDKESGKWFLRIFIFSTKHPVNHQDCENMTRGLGDLLDELLPFKYYLEVSSPGVERKLKSEKEYLIFRGKDIVIKTKEPIDSQIEIIRDKKKIKVGGEKKFEAKIIEYYPVRGIRILKSDTGEEHDIEFKNIVSARLQDK